MIKKRQTPKITSSLIMGMMTRSFISCAPLCSFSDFFDSYGAQLVLGNFADRIHRSMGQEVGGSLPEMERHKNHSALRASSIWILP